MGDLEDIVRELHDHEKRLRRVETQEIGLAGATAFVKLDEKSGSSAGYSFTSISGDYRHLLLISYLRSDRASVSNDNLAMTFNGDTGSNYEWVHMRWTNDTGSVGGNEFSQGATGDAHIEVSFVEAAAAAADVHSPTWILIPDYSNATDHKGCLSQTGWQIGAFAAETLGVDIGHGIWHNSTPAAITQVDLDPEIGTNWIAGSRATLYGIG